MMTDTRILTLCAANALGQAVFTAVDASLPDFLTQRYSLGPLSLGLVFSCILFAYTAACPLVGWLTDRFPRRRVHVMLACVLGFAPLLPFLEFSTTLPGVIAAFAGIGVLGAGVFTPHLPAVNEIIDQKYDGMYYGTCV